MMTFPPPYSPPFGMSPPSKVAYSRGGWSSVCTARWFTAGGVWQILRHRPRHQHAVTLQPEVVVQASRMVFLDHERVVLPPIAGLAAGTGSGVLAASRMLRYVVSRSYRGTSSSSPASRSPCSATRASTS